MSELQRIYVQRKERELEDHLKYINRHKHKEFNITFHDLSKSTGGECMEIKQLTKQRAREELESMFHESDAAQTATIVIDWMKDNNLFKPALTEDQAEKELKNLRGMNTKHSNIWYIAEYVLIEWLKERYPYIDIPDEFNAEIDHVEAAKAYTPQSPMAYSGEDIFFMHKGELLHIYLLDVDDKGNREFYNKVLASITLN